MFKASTPETSAKATLTEVLTPCMFKASTPATIRCLASEVLTPCMFKASTPKRWKTLRFKQVLTPCMFKASTPAPMNINNEDHGVDPLHVQDIYTRYNKITIQETRPSKT